MLQIYVHGLDLVVSGLNRVTGALQHTLPGLIDRLTARLQEHILQTKFEGQPLHASRGPLRAALTRGVAVGSEGFVIGFVGIKPSSPMAPAAGVHEYGGFSGFIRVPGHRRHVPSGGTTTVRPYSYRAKRRAFLHPTLDEMRGVIVTELARAADDVVADVSK